MNYFMNKKQALQMGANIFWLPAGVGRDHVLAAYRFKGVSSADFAIQDLTLHNYKLKISNEDVPTWDSTNGFTFASKKGGGKGYLDSNGLDKCDIKSAVVCFSGVTANECVPLITAGGASGKVQVFAATSAQVITALNDQTYEVQSEYRNYGGPGFVSSPYKQWNFVGKMRYSGGTHKSSGVIGVTWGETSAACKMYLDGIEAQTEETTSQYFHTYCDFGDGITRGHTFSNDHSPKAGLNARTFGERTLIAAAFYDIELTADDHAEIANAMLAL